MWDKDGDWVRYERDGINRATYEDGEAAWRRAQAYVEQDLACHLVMITENWQRSDVVVGSTMYLHGGTAHVDFELGRAGDHDASVGVCGRGQEVDSPKDRVVRIVGG